MWQRSGQQEVDYLQAKFEIHFISFVKIALLNIPHPPTYPILDVSENLSSAIYVM